MEPLIVFDRLITAVLVAIPVAVWVVYVTMWAIDGNISLLTATLSILVSIGLACLAIYPPFPRFTEIVLVLIATSLVFFPFAYYQVEKREMRLLDVVKLETVMRAFAERPDNIGARFELARLLYEFGMIGNAITLASDTVNALPDIKDPISNRSMRDQFTTEIQRLKNWKKAVAAKGTFQPLHCPICKRANPSNAIACVQCGTPYLLEIARNANVKARFLGKLVLTWIILAGLVALAPALMMRFAPGVALAMTLGLIVVSGIVLYLMFRKSSYAS